MTTNSLSEKAKRTHEALDKLIAAYEPAVVMAHVHGYRYEGPNLGAPAHAAIDELVAEARVLQQEMKVYDGIVDGLAQSPAVDAGKVRDAIIRLIPVKLSAASPTISYEVGQAISILEQALAGEKLRPNSV